MLRHFPQSLSVRKHKDGFSIHIDIKWPLHFRVYWYTHTDKTTEKKGGKLGKRVKSFDVLVGNSFVPVRSV